MAADSAKKLYRKNVAMVVLNAQGKLLACHRSDMTGAWQFPQGGMKEGETAEEAMYRELDEEIGTSNVEILYQLPTPLRYDWPEERYSRGFHGQEQTYFLVRLKQGARINLSKQKKKGKKPEFDHYQWLSSSEFISRLSGFKKEVYTKAILLLKKECGQLFDN